MKKFIILTVIAFTFVTGSFASNNEKTSSKAAAHLEANYANAKNVTWTYTENYAKASITIGQEKLDVYYDTYGELIGSTKTMAYDKLPKSALETFTTEYTFPDYQLTDCIAFTDADNNTNYFISFDLYGESVMLSISNNGTVSPM